LLVDRFIGVEHLRYDKTELNKILFFLKNIKDLTDDKIGGSITVAVNGDWGSGKTSYLKIAESFYRDYLGYPVLFFEAWKFQNDTDYFLSLIYELRRLPTIRSETKGKLTKFFKFVATNIAVAGKVFGKVDFRDVKDFMKLYEELTYEGYSKHRDETEQLRKIIEEILDYNANITESLLAKGIIFYNQFLWKALFKNDSLENLKSEFIRIANEYTGHTKQKFYKNNLNKILSDIEDFYNLTPSYKKEELIPSGRKLILIIDDLDRLIPRKAFKMIETLRFYFDVEDVIVLMGVNDKVIERYINKIYHLNDDDISDKFLEKVFQHSFRLPSSKVNKIHLRNIKDKNIKNLVEIVLNSFYLPHRKIIKIINRAIEISNRQRKEMDCINLFDAILEEVFPRYDFFKRENPNLSVSNLCYILKISKEQSISKNEGKINVDLEFDLIKNYINSLENDKVFINFPKNFLEKLCSQLESCIKIYQGKNTEF